MKPLQKVQYSLKLDLSWLRNEKIPLLDRITYLPKKYIALLSHQSNIPYLNNEINYDNVNTPATLQSYPEEILFLNKWLDFSKPRTILDVGANIGQFSITLASLFPTTTSIKSFEANPVIFQLLESNIKNIDNICAYNFALGPSGVLPFYYVPGASAKGSFLESNAVINLPGKTAETIDVELISLTPEKCNDLSIPNTYDLIKIDVEGFEYEVLDAIKDVEARYIYIEYSSSRQHQYSFHELLNKLEKYFGTLSILYCDKIDLDDTNRTIGNLLVRTSV